MYIYPLIYVSFYAPCPLPYLSPYVSPFSVSPVVYVCPLEAANEDTITAADLACSPPRFLSPLGPPRAIGDSQELLNVFKLFNKQQTSHKKNKFLLFVSAGTGEELIGSRQISQRCKCLFFFFFS